MSELNEYGKALEKYSKTLEGKPMPLHSWDFFSYYFDDLKATISDISQLKGMSKDKKWIANLDFSEQFQQEKVIVVTDVDLKIVFASQNIIKMTGYSFEEIVGKSPKIFQGKETSKRDLQQIREAIESKIPFEKTIINYKKNGETYTCHIKSFPLFNSKNEVVNFIAFEEVA